MKTLRRLSKIALSVSAVIGLALVGFSYAAPQKTVEESFSERVASGAATLMMKGIAAGYSAKTGVDTNVEVRTAPRLLQVNFTVAGDLQEFSEQMDGFAPFLSNVPGMVWKVWSVHETTRQANGTYLFNSQEAIDFYLAEIMPKGMENNPKVLDVEIRVYDVMENASRITHATLS
jgi:hypothetical protein